jgi:hypothetical protein
MVKMPLLFGMLVLELQSRCDRNCWFCMRQSSGARLRVREAMPTAEARRILWEASEMGFRSWVTFYLLSEPFLDNRLIEMARYARKLGMRPFVNTNGDVLRASPALRKLAVSVFEHIEVGLYRRATEAKDEQFWRSELGGKAVFKRMSAIGPRPHVPREAPTFPEAKCLRPLEKLVVQYDGRASLCCYDIDAAFAIPNAFVCSVEQLWHAPARVEAYRALAKPGGRKEFQLCRECVMPEVGMPRPFGDDDHA